MLSRTAGNLYWMGRYLERADFSARLIEATQRLAALPSSYGGASNAWESALAAACQTDGFAATGLAVDEHEVTEYLTLNAANSSSIRSCLEAARNNARAVRTAMTEEGWEAINTAWLEVSRYGTHLSSRETLAQLIEYVKHAIAAFDGANYRTMLRSDAFWFTNLGAAIERADNSARLLDVKYHLLLPRDEPVGGSLDYFQWTTILRTVSAMTAYRWVYNDSVKPWLVADLLICNRQIPRSLASCYDEILRQLDQLASHSGRRGLAHRLASAGHARLANGNIDSIFASGLHEFLTQFIADNNRLGDAIAEQYLF
ncbi:alpha-E domain-containing protein [Sandarakinorhabdus sp. AAP62]|uniref:alpha-E domain-containing protein n=1 Tax=Sandarakinorhabdus sp. AAP62 TaxID=1248916 RepID=UPI0002ED3601|nr:alpha-E domain-containing protein [Sandarakinorhabdus sp. AAP62]